MCRWQLERIIWLRGTWHCSRGTYKIYAGHTLNNVPHFSRQQQCGNLYVFYDSSDSLTLAITLALTHTHSTQARVDLFFSSLNAAAGALKNAGKRSLYLDEAN